MIQQKIYHLANSIYIEELRSITILMYRVHSLDLEKSLWNHHLKSGTGILKPNESNLKVWPEDVQTRVEVGPLLTTNSDSNQIELNKNYC